MEGIFVKNFKKYKYWLVLLPIVFAYLLFCVLFIHSLQKDGFVKWSSPDETANYIFTKLYGQEGRLTIFEKYNLEASDILMPRSFRSDNGNLKPVSFLGIILIYGQLAKIFSFKAIPYLTPVIASIGLIYFYLLISRIFNKKISLLSVLILAAFPAFVYYSIRSMFHNVLFISLLIIGLFYGVAAIQIKLKDNDKENSSSSVALKFFSMRDSAKSINWKILKSWLYIAISGFFFGLTIITRTSELIWILPTLFVIWIFYARQIGFFKLIIFISFLFLGTLPMLYYNQILYGMYYYGGYPAMNQSLQDAGMAGFNIFESLIKFDFAAIFAYFKQIFRIIFYFGFHPISSFVMFKNYFIKMFPWIFWPGVIGVLIYFIPYRKRKKRDYIYLLCYLIISLILIFYYGSWNFHDNPDLEAITIGNSYTRYWLPVYIGIMPFVGIFIISASCLIFKIMEIFLKKNEILIKSKNYFLFFMRAIAILIIWALSVNFLFNGSSEGLNYAFKKQADFKGQYEAILSLTEPNSVIITQYHDKLFFPERKVIVGLFTDKNINDLYAKLAKTLPVYYYNFKLSNSDLSYLNTRRLYESNLKIEAVQIISNEFALYKLQLNN